MSSSSLEERVRVLEVIIGNMKQAFEVKENWRLDPAMNIVREEQAKKAGLPSEAEQTYRENSDVVLPPELESSVVVKTDGVYPNGFLDKSVWAMVNDVLKQQGLKWVPGEKGVSKGAWRR